MARTLFAFFIASFLASPSFAIYTEIGLSYSYKKLTFDDYNNVESQGITGSLSFYIWERIALEVAYTNSLLVKREVQTPGPGTPTGSRLTSQNSDIYELNSQFLLGPDRKATFQPYFKAGVAYISKRQRVQIDGGDPFPVEPKPGLGPSVGIGIKILVNEALSIRFSYDVVRTPIEGTTTADDITGRAGLSWML